MLLPKTFCFYLLLNLSSAFYVKIAPKFNGEDSAVIMDADRPLPPRMHPKLQNALYYNYPVYRLIKQQQQQQQQQQQGELPTTSSTTSTTTTTTTTSSSSTTTTTEAPIVTPINDNDDEFPSDLLYIAQHKLGLKRLDEVPSITELGELLGTANTTDTIKYVRQLTATEQGVALMKAYIETPDYAENGSNNADGKNDVDDDDIDEDDINEETIDDDEVVETFVDSDDEQNQEEQTEEPEEEYGEAKISSKTQETSKTSSGFLESISSYMNSLWQETSVPTTTSTTTTTVAPPRFEVAPARNVQSYTPLFLSSSGQRSGVLMKPLLVRNPLPYHYPIPIRPFLIQAQTTNSIPKMSTTPQPVHLNTPKKNAPQTATSNVGLTNLALAPHVQQLAQMADVSPKQLELLLQRKPKLAELAVRVSNLPLTKPNGGGIDTQLFAAVQHAFEQDDDLKKLLSSVDTLK